MNTIKIDGLTAKEVIFLDKIWSLDSQDEVADWLETLNPNDTLIAKKLIDVLYYEIIDSGIQDEYQCTDARDILNKIFNK